MTLVEVSTQSAPAPGGHYSQGVVVNGTVYTSGQVGLDPETGTVEQGFEAQTRQALANLAAVLKASGAELTDVVKTTCFITNVSDFAEFNSIYAEFFGEHRPSRSTFAVGLAGGFKFEIEAIAVLGTA